MRDRMAGLIVGAAIAFAAWIPSSPASAATASSSCVGQEVSELSALGSGFGAAVSFEARNPELEGLNSLGEELSAIAHGDRSACPGE